ncbi:MAG: RNA methyltransferase [Thermodesulfovibrionales bacterium]
MKSWKENISFILVEPKEPGNIGASARAIKNMGFRNLEIAGKVDFITDESRWMACNAIDVLEGAKIFEDFKAAITEKNLIVGTTRRIGKRRGLILPITEGINRIRSVAVNNRVAILFGREDRGLFNNEVEECGFLITIPTDSSSPSLNLAQAVLLVAYELCRDVESIEMPALVAHEDLEVLYERLKETLKALDYIPRGDRDLERKIMRNIKHLIGRAGLTDWELRMLHGICSQVEKKIRS